MQTPAHGGSYLGFCTEKDSVAVLDCNSSVLSFPASMCLDTCGVEEEGLFKRPPFHVDLKSLKVRRKP